MPVTSSYRGKVWRRYARTRGKRMLFYSAPAAGQFTDSGTIPVTIVLSGTDTLDSVDAGTIPLTITLSGPDILASVDSGTIPLVVALSGTDSQGGTDTGAIPITITLSGVDTLASVDAGTIPITITMSGVEQFGPTTGQPFDDLRDNRSPKQLPIKP